MPARRHEPTYVTAPRYSKYSSLPRHDYGIDESLSRADYFSNAVLEDTFDQATRSRNRDHELLRNVNAAIPSSRSSLSRDVTPIRTGRPSSRKSPLPPVDIPSPSRALVPYKASNIDKLKSTAPSPTSLLSSRINSYLRGSSLPPQPLSRNTASNISYRSLITPRSMPEDTMSKVSYTSYLSDPVKTSPLSIRSSSLYPTYTPTSTTLPALPALPAPTRYRSVSPYQSRRDNSRDYDYAGSDEDDNDDYEVGGYKRKYKIIRAPAGSRYTGTRPAIDYPSSQVGSDDEDDVYYDASDSYGTYSCPRPSGTSPMQLSSYDGGYDGSYEADMAEMYDYVPFGPSRQGILELTEHEDSNKLPSSSYLTTTPSFSSLPRSSYSPPRSSYSPPRSLPSVSIVPYSKQLESSPSHTNHHMLDSLIADTAARAKAALKNSKLPEYKNASLVLSVEGSALSEDGKNRYGFRYYPPPIPLKGGHIGLDERILGVAPKPVSPADSFLCNYLNKLRDIRTDIRDHIDRGDYARGRSVAPSRPRSSSSAYNYRPSTYAHHTVHMPVTISGRSTEVPVSSYRSRTDDGQSHRVDVFPLVVSQTSLPKDKKFELPVYKAGGDKSSPNKLTVLEKINIKAAIIGSRLDPADDVKKQRRPRSMYAANKLRELKRDEIERKYK